MGKLLSFINFRGLFCSSGNNYLISATDILDLILVLLFDLQMTFSPLDIIDPLTQDTEATIIGVRNEWKLYFPFF